MTENEAIKKLEKFQLQIEHSIAEEDCCEYSNSEKFLQEDKEFLDAFNIAISALEEIQKYRKIGTVENIKLWCSLFGLGGFEELAAYRKIGTVEECREAREKQKPKKPRLNYKPKFFGKATYTCPKCGNICLEKFANERQNNRYCWDCGQAIDWSENLEGMEDK